MTASFAVCGGRIFDGKVFLDGQALLVEGGRIAAISDQSQVPEGTPKLDAKGAMIVPGFVDLQVNGGGGVLLNNAPNLEGIRTICAAHSKFGTTALLPTLITDTADIRKRAVAAGVEAQAACIPGYLGLHLEGPHLSVARKGTHDLAFIRAMDDADLVFLLDAVGTFGKALVTIAPESVLPTQVASLVDAGYVVSLGHTDVAGEAVPKYVAAGASMVTHLFNAMSQMANREPGLVGVALADGRLSCGLIADGFHVNSTVMQVALAAKRGPGRIFLVTDAMSTIGTNDTSFRLNGREVFRLKGRLTLADGTLAGADIDMLSCVRFVHENLGLPLSETLNMASLYPAQAIGCVSKGHLAAGTDADFLLLQDDLTLSATFIDGSCVYGDISLQGAIA